MKEADEDKHMTLDNAINRLDEIVYAAEKLHSAIIGCEDEAGDAVKKCSPSLEDVLTNGPGRIDARREEIVECLEKIRNSLF